MQQVPGRLKRRVIASLGGAVLGLGCVLRTALANGPTAQDVTILSHVVTYMVPAPTGTVEIGIVYPPASPTGKNEAERLAGALGGSLRANAVTVRLRLIPSDDIPPGITALLLTSAAESHAAGIARATSGKGVLVASTDMASLQAGQVAIVIQSEPRKEIFLNRAATETAGVRFATAFRMMVREQ